MMKDRFGRKIEYLRLSVTDLCNYRCVYCMDEDGVKKKLHNEILSIEELSEIAKAAIDLGVKKIRLTGGEPLVRKGLLTLCRNIKAYDNSVELSLTTNGSLLSDLAEKLKDSGVDRLNISLDTLNEEKFRHITRRGELRDVLFGIEAAKSAGFQNIKINTVLIGGVNTDEIEDIAALSRDKAVSVRFIELMPMNITKNWEKERFVTNDLVLNKLKDATLVRFDGICAVYRLFHHQGTVGLISPLSNAFCEKCNRIRVTADGKLKPCLHSDDEIDLRGLIGEDLKKAILDGVNRKPERHQLTAAASNATRNMNEIGG